MDHSIRLGAGPVIQVKDAGIITDSAIRTVLVEAARKNGIPFQLGVTSTGRTDAAMIQRTKKGIRSGVLAIPRRYSHSPTEMIDLLDLEYARELLYHFILTWVGSQFI